MGTDMLDAVKNAALTEAGEGRHHLPAENTAVVEGGESGTHAPIDRAIWRVLSEDVVE